MDCLFCMIADGELEAKECPENTVLMRTENFFVKPALGAFVEGYCLIIANDHYRTMAEMSERELDELEELATKVRTKLTLMYGTEVCTFEHGAVCPGSNAGSCIDHAHLHMLPVACDVENHLTQWQARQLCRLRDLRELAIEGKSYILWARNPTSPKVFVCEDRIPSQFMRRAICEQLGTPHLWDWRQQPLREKISQFITKWRRAEGANTAESENYASMILTGGPLAACR